MNNPARNNWMIDCLKGEDVFILASGPSLKDFNFNRLKGKKVIAVNFSILHWPDSQYLVGLDGKFYSGLRAEGIEPRELKCKIIAGGASNMKPGGNVSVVTIRNKFSSDPRSMYGPMTSTLVAINFAIIANAKRIFLLGVDQKYSDDFNDNGKGRHFYDNNYPFQNNVEEKKYTRVAKGFRVFVGKADIINLNPDSGVDCFEFGDIDKILSIMEFDESFVL